MKNCTILILAFLLSGCASITMTKTEDSVTWSSKTLFKDISEVDASSLDEDFTFNMGSSAGSLSDMQTQAVLCVLNPALCQK